MSSNKKRSTNRASKSKQTQIYTPDTAPIIYTDALEEKKTENVQIVTESDSVITDESYKSSATQKEESKTEQSVVVKASTTFDTTFLTNKVSCRLVGRTPLRNKTLLTVKELIQLVLNNSLGAYAVVTTPQTKIQIINAIRNCDNSVIGTNLTLAQKEERVKRFEEDMKVYKL